jgi:hypothetical protein
MYWDMFDLSGCTAHQAPANGKQIHLTEELIMTANRISIYAGNILVLACFLAIAPAQAEPQLSPGAAEVARLYGVSALLDRLAQNRAEEGGRPTLETLVLHEQIFESNGSGSEEPLLESSLNKVLTDWSPDGRFLLYIEVDPKTQGNLWALPLFGERKPFPIVSTSFDESNGQFSPDGRWVAYHTDESGRYEVYAQPFPGPGGKWQVSTGGGIEPRWRRDGKEIFYVAPDGKMMAAPIKGAGQTLEAGAPVTLFQTRIVGGGTIGRQKQQYAVTPDGQRFLINTIANASTSSSITIVTNWTAGLKQ